MKKIFLTSLVSLFAVSGIANAETYKPYLGAKLGYDITHAKATHSSSHDSGNANGFLVSADMGVELYTDANFGIRGEIEYTYDYAWDAEINKKSNIDISSNTMLANMYVDMATNWMLTPYASAGIGYNWTTVRGDINKTTDDDIAWQVGGGLTYNISPCMKMDIGYRYLDKGKIEDGHGINRIKVESYAHQIYTGGRYMF